MFIYLLQSQIKDSKEGPLQLLQYPFCTNIMHAIVLSIREEVEIKTEVTQEEVAEEEE